jgi:hypothetical protein
MISDMVDVELSKKGYVAYFACSRATEYGATPDLRIASNINLRKLLNYMAIN